MTRQRILLGFVLLVLLVLLAGVAGRAAAEATIPCGRTIAATASLVAGEEPAWRGAIETQVALNRTPPLYVGDPPDDGARPAAAVSLLSNGEATFVRMRWADPTDSRARSPERIADAGDSTIYKAHSLDIERFADAACVMFPQNVQNAQDAASFPSLMMGDAAHPVDLYYWHGTRGFERLIAAGRGTTTRTGQAIPGSVRRTADGWECVFQIPPAAAGTPIAFAVWDGEKQQRDGLKFYSVWYELREIGGAP